MPRKKLNLNEKKVTVTIRLDPKLLKEIKEDAKKEGVSQAKIINAIIEKWYS